MPTTPTYPGVYIEEIPSGVRTITGVSTSVTAFVGYTRNGPVSKAEEILSFADFERKFGGLAKDSPLSYTVQHFFMNGGQQAYVVRLANSATEAAITLNSIDAGAVEPALRVTAREPSARTNGMEIGVDYDTAHPDSTFNLRVEDPGTGRAEEFLGVTMNSKSRRNVDSVINGTSQLIEVRTEEDALSDVGSDTGQSQSGRGIIHTAVDAGHRQFVITLDEEDGPKLVTIYDGSTGQRPTSLQNLGEKIRSAVRALGSGVAYQSFDFQANATNGTLTLISGEQGDGSFVRVTSAGALDAARVLKLGVANGGREVDAAAGIRPAPIGTTSGRLEQLPAFSSDRKLLVTIDGDGPHEVSVFRSGTDTPPADLKALRLLLQERLRQVKPQQSGSMAFMGIDAEVVGDAIQILSGAEDDNSLVQFENLRVLASLNSVSFVSATQGWAVGDAGIILKTTNGGTAWSVENPPASAATTNLRGTFFRTNALGWAVGDAGTVLHWNGTSWAARSSGVTQRLRGVSFKSDDEGLAVGEAGTIRRTTNAAGSWSASQPLPTPAQNANLRGVSFRSGSQTAWAVGEKGTILVSTDDGNNWAVPQNPPAPAVTADLNAVHMSSVSLGLAVGDNGTILIGTNNGNNWAAPQNPVTGLTANLNGVFFVDANNAWAVGDSGTILKGTNNGNNWAIQNSGTTTNLRGLHFNSANEGWAVGEGGIILKTTNGGATWAVQQAVTDPSADLLKLTASTSSQNVKNYTMGVGKTLGAQSGATPGQDGQPPLAADFQGSEDKKSGIHALLDVGLFNILCLPGVTDFEPNDAIAVLSTAIPFCERRRAFCIIDSPESWTTFDDAIDHLPDFNSVRSKNAAMYFPRVQMPDPLDDNRLRTFPPSGIIAGIYARTDATRGVWKAPAGQEASLTGVRSLVYKLTDRENGLLNPLGLNCLRVFPIVGPVNWGARTLHGADVLASEWKYIPVRRLALFLEESLYRGMQWVVFEPNDEPLWAQIRLNVGAFMQNLFRQGAFQGTSPREAYFVRCDKETTTQNDIDRGIVNILVGFAPLKPAEFVIVKIQQMAGQIET